MTGAYAIAVMDRERPDCLVGARLGSPLIIGIGVGEHFLASDMGALIPVTQSFMVLEEGDVVEIAREEITIYDHAGKLAHRDVVKSELHARCRGAG